MISSPFDMPFIQFNIQNMEFNDSLYFGCSDVMVTAPATPIKRSFDKTYPIVPIKAQFKNITQLAYINDLIVDCRLKGLYMLLKDKKYEKASAVIGDSINMMLKATEIDMDKRIHKKIIAEFYHMYVEIALKKYNAVHDRIRDMHYYIVRLHFDTL
jgi:hypothetical protein